MASGSSALTVVEKPWQFRPGVSGNPNGRPKGVAALAQRIRRETKAGRTLVEFLVDRMLRGRTDQARIQAAALLLAYGFGKPVQQLEVSGPGGRRIVIGYEDGAQDERAADYPTS